MDFSGNEIKNSGCLQRAAMSLTLILTSGGRKSLFKALKRGKTNGAMGVQNENLCKWSKSAVHHLMTTHLDLIFFSFSCLRVCFRHPPPNSIFYSKLLLSLYINSGIGLIHRHSDRGITVMDCFWRAWCEALLLTRVPQGQFHHLSEWFTRRQNGHTCCVSTCRWRMSRARD